MMPVLAIDENLAVRAVWASGEGFLNDPQAVGADMSERIQQIHDFLVPLSAAF